MTPPSPRSSLVYSTDLGRTCPGCRQAVTRCTCRSASAAPAAKGPVKVSRETAGRGGKAVTVVRGLALAEPELVALGKALKAACGAGGTVKDGAIEVQGDHVERVMQALAQAGWKPRRAGG